ncbi:phosphogluconate dehydratase [Biformimicrobium ophioploci]|uniref:Phosphogluconate dehydratase n=1 Tax=Biformimicrobium ophioploci TaxID=3036711 RepID=A0ABQ6LWP5_9GAMM|nr:phosphogluconate dehydratase [Microbulbifer sp. NKW57]GMG86523.1 phosphogluconate dehydratase [Microbulbifer sp. NKW57]
MLNALVAAVTDRIRERSADTRGDYLQRLRAASATGRTRTRLSCGNLAHGFAACSQSDKDLIAAGQAPNLGVITAYNDMLSAHQPYENYPEKIREAARACGATAQVAGGVPAMCDGVTQGREGMELSLLSRDVIAMSTAVALSHDMFDAALYLGVCDKIVPGLIIGALSFGHLPGIFVPAGPMTSGLPNSEKARVRQLYAEGKAGRAELLQAESASYHSPGTCTFYGTANSNQMLMEIMGVHLPGSAFINPNTPLREALTKRAVTQLVNTIDRGTAKPLGEILDERAFVNGIVGLLATGGSTNHTLHLIAMARAAGILIDWSDMAELSSAVPLLCRVYPNGMADINHFHAAGGMPFLTRELASAGLLHTDVNTVMGEGGLEAYFEEPKLQGEDEVFWSAAPQESADTEVLRPAVDPFAAEGGLKLLQGNLGRSVIKVSAVKEDHRVIRAPAIVLDSQDALLDKFKAGELEKDFIAVIRFQGPRANGMPELHKLTPPLGVLQDRGFKVALVTDGRMSGASGKVPAAIHMSPEAVAGGAIARLRDGDMLTLDAVAGTLAVELSEVELADRQPATADLTPNNFGMGRELFARLRTGASEAESGASILFSSESDDAASPRNKG